MSTGKVLFALALGVAAAGCMPHYSVAVARGPGHVTYAQRHNNPEVNDYLVDCKLPAGSDKPTDCYVVELKGEK